jgi:hypothetical protein
MWPVNVAEDYSAYNIENRKVVTSVGRDFRHVIVITQLLYHLLNISILGKVVRV